MKIRERAMRVKRAAVSIHHAIHLARSIIEVVVEVEHIIQSITNVVRITLSSLRDHVDLSSESAPLTPEVVQQRLLSDFGNWFTDNDLIIAFLMF